MAWLIMLSASVLSWAANESPLTEIRAAMATHQTAASYMDWHESPYSPESLGERLTAQAQDPKFAAALCRTLRALPVADLFYVHEFLEQAKGKCFRTQKARYLGYLAAAQTRLLKRQATFQRPPVDGVTTLGPTVEVPLNVEETAVVTDGKLPPKTLVLTFDDGPHALRTHALLKILKDQDLKAQFFLVGRNTILYPDAVKAAHAEGHEVGCHSFTHPDLRKLAHSAAIKEIEDGFAAITSVLGASGTFFRYPYGARTGALQAYLVEKRTTDFLWNIDTLDWKYKDPDFLLSYALKQVESEGRGVVLFHDIQPQTLAIMPAFLAHLKEQGYQTAIFRPSQARVSPLP